MDDKQRAFDPWTDPDPDPEKVEEFFSDPDNHVVFHRPGNPSARTIFIGDEVPNEWIQKREAAHARGERLPEEIEADEAYERELARRAREALEQLNH